MKILRTFFITVVIIAGIGLYLNAKAQEKPYKPGYHSITEAEFKQMEVNYEKHEAAGTLGKVPEYSAFDPDEVFALRALLGSKFLIYHRVAHKDGTPATVIKYGTGYIQKSLDCPPNCPDDISLNDKTPE
jgi:predicted metal-dependent phosphotriesterase family hydrolase